MNPRQPHYCNVRTKCCVHVVMTRLPHPCTCFAPSSSHVSGFRVSCFLNSVFTHFGPQTLLGETKCVCTISGLLSLPVDVRAVLTTSHLLGFLAKVKCRYICTCTCCFVLIRFSHHLRAQSRTFEIQAHGRREKKRRQGILHATPQEITNWPNNNHQSVITVITYLQFYCPALPPRGVALCFFRVPDDVDNGHR